MKRRSTMGGAIHAYTTLAASKDFAKRAAERAKENRTCPDCGSRLSCYNPGPLCWKCERDGRMPPVKKPTGLPCGAIPYDRQLAKAGHRCGKPTRHDRAHVSFTRNGAPIAVWLNIKDDK